jgi:hypothetical protein
VKLIEPAILCLVAACIGFFGIGIVAANLYAGGVAGSETLVIRL